MSTLTGPLSEQREFGATSRRDGWWVVPLLTFLGLSAFVVYATWAAFQGDHYTFGNYLSPFYSPELFGDSPHAWFGPKPSFWPSFLPCSPPLLILWAPGGFRLTCYSTGARTTKRSGRTRRPAPWASRESPIAERQRCRSSSRTSIATFSISPSLFSSSSPMTPGKPCGSWIRPRERSDSASGWERSCSR